MSQAKVDKYKENKANRKEIMKKEKRVRRLEKIGVSILGLVIVGWLGFSVYSAYENSIPKETAEVNYSAVEDYLSNISK